MSLFDLLVSARKGSLTMAITVALLIGLIVQLDQAITDRTALLSSATVSKAHGAAPDTTPY
ncbi:hypothetical protein CH92_20860 [Stutzerimonas stutzeri]|uniref:Uncharacterized protein n=1 Tax=Stutzerimonas stutzeri TaxID=316 RepID=W8R4W4_STUST|nr:hypothetical protein [Stutzerimonas stutzeri]AHL77699.1 hypothetical protein CH92_20860 [Stutzerimonas stutzeri]MCQ4330293.1 hypothetical protein [Stutzerimonas stutzeri]